MSDYCDHGSLPALPLAYFLTFRCYGTWLHGDPRGSIDRNHNAYGAPMIPASERLENSDRGQLKHPPVTLDGRQRSVVEAAIRGVCAHRQYVLHALNVRTNHVHCVVAVAPPSPAAQPPALADARATVTARLSTVGTDEGALPNGRATVARPVARPSESSPSPTVARASESAFCKPEPILDSLKAYATRALRQAGLIGSHTRPWSRHGSTIYLWTDHEVAKAIEYVTAGQGDEWFSRDAAPRAR